MAIRNTHKNLVRKPQGKSVCGRLENNIKIDFREIGCEGVHWIQQVQDRVQG
jgi:hypothetical protein